MRMSLAEIAKFLNGKLVDADNPDVEIARIVSIEVAQAGDITFLENKKFNALFEDCQASAIICRSNMKSKPHKAALIVVPQPYVAFARLMQKWHVKAPEWTGVHARALVEEGAQVADEVCVGPFVHVGRGAVIEKHVQIGAGCVIGEGAHIGEGSILKPNVSVYDGCQVGKNCILHSGVVIGSDGYGFASDLMMGVHEKIPQVGIVVLEDNVELGANTVVDRAVLGETRIGAGTKVDNLVQIAHNVQIGKGCLIVAQAGVAGSTTLGNFVVLAGQVGITGHLNIGDGAQIGAQSGVSSDIPAGAKVLGSPAHDGKAELKIMVARKRIPQMRKTLKELERTVEALQSQVEELQSQS